MVCVKKKRFKVFFSSSFLSFCRQKNEKTITTIEGKKARRAQPGFVSSQRQTARFPFPLVQLQAAGSALCLAWSRGRIVQGKTKEKAESFLAFLRIVCFQSLRRRQANGSDADMPPRGRAALQLARPVPGGARAGLLVGSAVCLSGEMEEREREMRERHFSPLAPFFFSQPSLPVLLLLHLPLPLSPLLLSADTTLGPVRGAPRPGLLAGLRRHRDRLRDPRPRRPEARPANPRAGRRRPRRRREPGQGPGRHRPQPRRAGRRRLPGHPQRLHL